MNTPVYYTYDVLYNMIQTSAQRNDIKFLDLIPTFIANAENRLAIMLKNLGQLQIVNTAPATQTTAKPNRWHITTSISVTNVESGEISYLLERTYEFVTQFQNELTSLYPIVLPQFYADVDFDHFVITPWLPDLAGGWKLQLLYYERPLPLSSQNQQNWWTSYAPQALLYACMRETAIWARTPDRVQHFDALLQGEVSALNKEDMRRDNDRSYNTMPPLA